MASRIIAQVLLYGASVVGRAFIQAYQQALANGTRPGAAAAARGARTLQAAEAAEILGVKQNGGLKEIYTKYDKLFAANDPKSGGSLYLQAKIHHAKSLLEREAVARGETARVESPPDGAEDVKEPPKQI